MRDKEHAAEQPSTKTPRAAAEPAAPAGHHLSRRATLLVFAALMLSMFASSLDQTITSTALPTIVGELGGATHLLWVSTAYMLCSCVTMPLYGTLGDLFGRKHLFCLSQALFVAGSLIASCATDMTVLVVGRAVQGLGGGGAMILSQAIVADLFCPRERGKYMGVMGAAFGASALFGPMLGGLFTDVLGWRWCFYINIPIGIVCVVLAAKFLPHRAHEGASRRLIDARGVATLAVATSCFVLAMSWGGNLYEWASPVILGLFTVAAVFAVLFVAAERHAAHPIIALKYFGNRNFMICTVAGLLIMAGMMGVSMYLPTYFQIVEGASATASGYMMMPMLVAMMASSTAVGFLVSKLGRTKPFVLTSVLLCAAAFALLSTISADMPYWVVAIFLFIEGVGMGLGMQVLVLVVQNEFSVAEVGSATASNNFFRELGGTVGSALVGSLFTANLTAQLEGNLAGSGGLAAIGGSADAITPALVSGLDGALQSLVQAAYNDALAPVFAMLVPVLLVAFALLLLMRERPLKTENE